MAALHVGSERLLAGFDDWKGSHTLDALRGRRTYTLGIYQDFDRISKRILLGFSGF